MAELKTVDIKGKEYVMVHERIRAFREEHPNFGLLSEILSIGDGIVTMKAIITDETGRVLATGHAQEKEQSSYINKTSYVENCETSAFGRALGALGIGIDTSFATADEVANAIKQQGDIKKTAKQRKEEEDAKFAGQKDNFQSDMDAIPLATAKQIEELRAGLKSLDQSEEDFLKKKKLACLDEITELAAGKMIEAMKERIKEKIKKDGAA